MIISQKEVYLKLLSKIIFFVLTTWFFLSCAPAETKTTPEVSNVVLTNNYPIKYAKRFSISERENFKALFLFGNKDANDTTSVFILYSGVSKPAVNFKNAYYVKVPVNNIASMSSVYGAMLSKLNLIDKIVAIESVDYYNNEKIIAGVKSGKILEIAKGPEMNVEQTLMLHPELILMFGMGDPKQDVSQKIIDSKIPVAISLDHLEEHPLARAEWIKFIAAFFNKEQLADSLFNCTEQNYNLLVSVCDTIRTAPTVLTEIKYADAWYVPGGKSFMAHILKDAKADYLWKDENKAGSIPLSFEQVYSKAKNADYWLNLFININSKKELIAYDTRYNLFKAYKEGNLFNNNKKVNGNGYSDYWETGMANPDELLKDLIKIIHPILLPQHELKYYKKIN